MSSGCLWLGASSPARPAGCRSRAQAAFRCEAGGPLTDQGQPGLSPPTPPATTSRRHLLLRSSALPWAVLAAGGLADGPDPTTVVNAVLGAYGLPQLRAGQGFKYYDDFDADYVFEYPRAWVGRKNSQRPGVYFSDFNTADKCTVEAFPLDVSLSPSGRGRASSSGAAALPECGARVCEPSSSSQLASLSGGGGGRDAAVARVAAAAVAALVNPGGEKDPEVGGDARLELPAASQVKTSVEEIDGMVYVYLAFPSSTTTRSGYDIRRKNYAVATVRRGTAYVLGASARRDKFDADKEELLKHIVASFRLR